MTSYKLLRCIRKRIIVRQTTTPKGTYNSSLVACSFYHRQHHRKPASFPRFRPQFDFAPQFFYNHLADGKSQAGSLRKLILFIEATKDHFLF